MAHPQGVGQPHNEDNSLAWLMVFIALALLLSYVLAHGEPFFRVWKAFITPQAQVLAWLAGTPPGEWVAQRLGDSRLTLESLAVTLRDIRPGRLDWQLVRDVSNHIGRYLNLVGLPLMLLFVISAWKQSEGRRGPAMRVRNTQAMRRYLAGGYPWLHESPDATSAKLWGGAHPAPLTPHRFADHHGLIINEGLDTGRALEVYQQSLGRRFTGWETLHNQPYGFVAAAILARAPRKHHAGLLEYAARGHLYDSTVLVSLLLGARRFGVIHNSYFRRLRQVNRGLYMALSGAGRLVAWAEGSGIMAQYHYEMELLCIGDGNIPPVEGRVDEAVKSLAEALETDPSEHPWRLDKELWKNYDPTR